MVALGIGGGASAAVTPPTEPPVTALAPVPTSVGARTVTLPTGDRVSVTTGDHPTATVIETAAGTRSFTIVRAGRALFVIPDQAMRLLAGEWLDRRLFDVTGLVEQGYDDASTATLPVIIEYSGGSR